MNGLNRRIFKHPSVYVYGEVEIGKGSSLWTYSVIRAEMHSVKIGEFVNIQDFCMIHVGDRTDSIIGDFCSIAHRAVIHGATIGNNCLVGVGAIVMDGCVIGDNSIIGAGCYLAPGMVVPENSIVQGNPAEIVKTRNNFVANRMNAIYYNINAEHYMQGHYRAWSDEAVKKQVKGYFSQVTKEFRRQREPA